VASLSPVNGFDLTKLNSNDSCKNKMQGDSACNQLEEKTVKLFLFCLCVVMCHKTPPVSVNMGGKLIRVV